ncbi:hypothetical protein HOY80DRAFT_967358 [Tuber brumale]|nr:hypothetical protein HOY80DRAFT_967358 [Tuber brumale]
MSDFCSPTVVCEDPEKCGRAYGQRFEDCWGRCPMHPQSSFIDRDEHRRGCSVRAVYHPPLHSKPDATSPYSIPLDSLYAGCENVYDDDYSIFSLGSSDMEAYICNALCFNEGGEGCLPDCFLSLGSHAEEFRIVIRCTMICIGGDPLVGGVTLSLLVCAQGCLMESTAGPLPPITSSGIPSGLTSELPGTISLPFNETNSTRVMAQSAMHKLSSAGSTYNFRRYHTWIPPIILSVVLGLF